jgi:hypothetical protein
MDIVIFTVFVPGNTVQRSTLMQTVPRVHEHVPLYSPGALYTDASICPQTNLVLGHSTIYNGTLGPALQLVYIA